MATGGNVPALGGYKYEFIRKVPEDLECPVCNLTLKDPVQIKGCGHRFCNICMETLLRYPSPTCPADRGPLSREKIFQDAACHRQILDLHVKCRQYGCLWTGELRAVEGHQSECPFKVVKCSNSRCTEMLMKRDMKTHVTKECSWRKVNCKYCQESVIMNQQQNHFDICQKFPVLCTNKCGVKDIPREKLEVHVRDECRVTKVQCAYNYLGCDAMFPRSATKSHYKTQTKSHFDLVLRRVHDLEAERDRLMSNNNQQSQQIKQQWVQITQQSQEIERSMSKDRQKAQQIERQSKQINQQLQEIEILKCKDKQQSQEIERLSRQIEEQSREMKTLKSKDKQQSQPIGQQSGWIEQESQQIERLMSKDKQQPQQAQRLLRRIEQLSREKERLVSEDKQKSQQIERKSEQMEQQLQEIEILKCKDKQQSQEIERLSRQIEEQLQEIKTLKSKKSQQMVRFFFESRRKEQQSQETKTLKSKDKQQSQEIERQSRQIEEHAKEIGSLKSKVKQQSQQIVQKARRIEQQSQQIERLTSKDEQQSQKIKGLTFVVVCFAFLFFCLALCIVVIPGNTSLTD